MIHKEIEDALNMQVASESDSSNLYLAMASWAETNGYEGSANFLYKHSDEERMHMLKLVRYINERGGRAKITSLKEPRMEFDSLMDIFETLLNHEIKVSEEINEIVHICLQKRDYTTHNFLQWYVAEQIEEEALARSVMDKLKLVGNDKGGLYLFDRDVAQMNVV